MMNFIQNSQIGNEADLQSHSQLDMNCKQKKTRKPSSHLSTRKSSTDSIELKVKFKTQFCKYWTLNIECPFRQICSFAHGETQIRSKDSLPNGYKTKLCNSFINLGFCNYGIRCQFIHRKPQQHKIKYKDILDKIKSNPKQFFSYVTQKQRSLGQPKMRRLSIFIEMAKRQDVIEEVDEELQQVGYSMIPQSFEGMRPRHNSI